jgi:hypothetical protein
MAQEFQTSFIPKKTFDIGGPPARSSKASLSGIISFVAFIIFMVSIVGGVGVFLYGRFLIASIASKKESLERARAAFEPELIRELSRLDSKLRLSQSLLDAHVAPSGIFDLLESLTLETVRFTDMSYTMDDQSIRLSLSGEALSFASIALQSDEFGKNRRITEPVFSGLTLDEKGNVRFTVEALIDPSLLSYRERATHGGTALFELKEDVAEEPEVAGAATTTSAIPLAPGQL